MSAEDLEKYETEMELTLYREYRDVVGIFKYVVETDRRFYLCNQVDVKARTEQGDVFFDTPDGYAAWKVSRPRFHVQVLDPPRTARSTESKSTASDAPPSRPCLR